MNLNQTITFEETVFAQEIDGEMVLLDMNSENYFGLDSVGTDIWQTLQETKKINKVLDILINMYDIDKITLQKDMFQFLEELEKNNLISIA